MKFYITKNGLLQRTGDCPRAWFAQQIHADEEIFEGDPPAEVIPIPPTPTLAELKLAKGLEIKRAMSAAINGGFTAGSFTWDSDLAAQQQMQLTWQDMKEADGPTTVTWYTSDGAAKTLNLTQFKALARALRNHIQAQKDKAATLRAQIVAATTADEVAAIVW